MSIMANPIEALQSYQHALNGGAFDPSLLNADYMKNSGQVAGATRFDYVKIIDGTIQALAMFIDDEPFKGIARYSLAYAVNEKFRGRGLAVEAVNVGIQDLSEKLSRINVNEFIVEALIDTTNVPSINVAKRIFGDSGFATTDSETGTPALLFYKKILV